jgi:predicted phage tail component-like protein
MTVTIQFNGITSDDVTFGIHSVTDIKRPILQDRRENTRDIKDRTGEYDFGSDLGPIDIPCTLVLQASTKELMRQYARAISEWLNVEEVQELIFSDEPDVYYMARIKGPVYLDENGEVGRVNVIFYVPDGYAHSSTLTEFNSASGNLTVTNSGTTETPVYIEATINEATASSLTLEISETEYLTIEYSFVEDDVIEINTQTRSILLGTTDLRPYKTLGSSFWKVPTPGAIVTPTPASTSIDLFIRERWT